MHRATEFVLFASCTTLGISSSIQPPPPPSPPRLSRSIHDMPQQHSFAIPVHHTIQVIRSFSPSLSTLFSSSFILVFVWATCMWLMLMPFKRWFTIKFVIMHICFVPQPVFGCDTFSSGVVVFRWESQSEMIYLSHPFFLIVFCPPSEPFIMIFYFEKLAFARWLIRCCLLLMISLSTAQSLSHTLCVIRWKSIPQRQQNCVRNLKSVRTINGY